MQNLLFDYLSKYIAISEEEKKAITDLDMFRNYEKGTILLETGQSSEKGYFVIKGCLRTYYIIEGEEKTTNFYTELESLAPVCSITKKPSEYSVSCVEDSIIMVSDPSMEEVIFEKFPRFETLCRVLSEELLVNHQTTFDNFKISSPEQRYLNLMKNRPDLLQRVPQYQLASYLGIKPQSLSRLRSRLAEKGK
ncbi:Crp/Fnr family transcriptional regulator [Bernardetia sp. ABR2-2B]|uniref:Crp/Fnr family transcriptional regulator n=1 Tax=Bernardetia sp. ABR2-2B TaxID=3127472 RepID=UPI0030D3C6D8